MLLMARGEVKDSDSEHESDGDEDHPKPYEQEMRDLKNEVLEGIKKEEYPLSLRERSFITGRRWSLRTTTSSSKRGISQRTWRRTSPPS